jgi:hypothetical protein
MLVMEALHPAMEQQQAAAREAAAAAAAAASPPAAFGSPLQLPGAAPTAPHALAAAPLLAAQAAQGVCAPLPPDALLAAWAEAAGDVRDALSAAAELVGACGAMGRLQAVLEAEEMRRRFSAAARELGLALSGLQPLQGAAPADAAEDLATAQRQLAALRFSPSTQAEALSGALLRAVVLQGVGRAGGAQLAPLLTEALALAGLEAPAAAAAGQPWPEPPAWLEFEARRMRDGAAAAAASGDQVAEFFYHQVTLALLALVCGGWPPETAAEQAGAAPQLNGLSAEEQEEGGSLAAQLQRRLAAWSLGGGEAGGSAPPLPAGSLAALNSLTGGAQGPASPSTGQLGSHSRRQRTTCPPRRPSACGGRRLHAPDSQRRHLCSPQPRIPAAFGLHHFPTACSCCTPVLLASAPQRTPCRGSQRRRSRGRATPLPSCSPPTRLPW